MKIGYACLTIGVPNTDFKSCLLKNATQEALMKLVSHNLQSLHNIIDYNRKNNIKLFRISSDLIPFGSSVKVHFPWWELFSEQLKNIGEEMKESGMRVSMHPGQYTVLNSPNEDVVQKAVLDLQYHEKVLSSLGLGFEHKIILHIGGVYDDKEKAMNRFLLNYKNLSENIKNRLVIENDDKLYTIGDVLSLSQNLSIPVVFDTLHHAVNPPLINKSEEYWIIKCKETWMKKDGDQKIHYSQQDVTKKKGAHSPTIFIEPFLDFYHQLNDKNIDIMLEVKDKNLSCLKCINCTQKGKSISAIEKEWRKYKYSVLEKSQKDYLEIRKILKEKKKDYEIKFYCLLEQALQKENEMGNSENAALHIWGYFKDKATESEKNKFFKSLEQFKQGKTSIKIVKNILCKLSNQYKQQYLLDSYYFEL